MADTVALNVDRHRLNNLLSPSKSRMPLSITFTGHLRPWLLSGAAVVGGLLMFALVYGQRTSTGRHLPPELDLEAC